MLVVINGSQPVILGGALDVISHHRVHDVESAALVRQKPADESPDCCWHVLIILHEFLDSTSRESSHGVRLRAIGSSGCQDQAVDVSWWVGSRSSVTHGDHQ